MIFKTDIDKNTVGLLEWLADACKLTVSQLVDRLLSGHLEELWDLRSYLEAHSANSEKFEKAVNLLVSYGGGDKDLASGLKRIDSSFETLGNLLKDTIERAPQTAH